MAKIALYETEDPGDRKCKDICHDPKCHVRSKKADKWKVVRWGNNVISAWLFVWPWKRNTPWCNQVLCHDWKESIEGQVCSAIFASSHQTMFKRQKLRQPLKWICITMCDISMNIATFQEEWPGMKAQCQKPEFSSLKKYRSWLISPKYTVLPPAEFCQSMTKRGRSGKC